jgi:hypothetical protein
MNFNPFRLIVGVGCSSSIKVIGVILLFCREAKKQHRCVLCNKWLPNLTRHLLEVEEIPRDELQKYVPYKLRAGHESEEASSTARSRTSKRSETSSRSSTRSTSSVKGKVDVEAPKKSSTLSVSESKGTSKKGKVSKAANPTTPSASVRESTTSRKDEKIVPKRTPTKKGPIKKGVEATTPVKIPLKSPAKIAAKSPGKVRPSEEVPSTIISLKDPEMVSSAAGTLPAQASTSETTPIKAVAEVSVGEKESVPARSMEDVTPEKLPLKKRTPKRKVPAKEVLKIKTGRKTPRKTRTKSQDEDEDSENFELDFVSHESVENEGINYD